MKNTYTGYTRLPGKKKCISFKKFFFFLKPPRETTRTQKETAQPLLICGVCEPKACSWNHSSPGRACAEIPDRQLSNWTKHTWWRPEGQEEWLLQWALQVSRGYLFLQPRLLQQRDGQCGTWTRWSPLSRMQWIMELDVTRFRKTSTAFLLTSVGARLKFTHTGCVWIWN